MITAMCWYLCKKAETGIAGVTFIFCGLMLDIWSCFFIMLWRVLCAEAGVPF